MIDLIKKWMGGMVQGMRNSLDYVGTKIKLSAGFLSAQAARLPVRTEYGLYFVAGVVVIGALVAYIYYVRPHFPQWLSQVSVQSSKQTPVQAPQQNLEGLQNQLEAHITATARKLNELGKRIDSLENEEMQDAKRRALADAAIKEEVVAQLGALKEGMTKEQKRQELFGKYVAGK